MAYLIPTLHPAHILRGAPYTDVVFEDLKKAIRLSELGPDQRENLVVVHGANPLGLYQSCKLACDWMESWYHKQCAVAVDVETSSVNYMACKLYSIALAGEDGNNTAVAFTLHDWQTVPADAEAALVSRLRALLAHPNIMKVFHNAPFDMVVLRQHGYEINGPVFDTQGAHHLVQPDIPHDLGWIGHTYLDVEPWKLNHEGHKTAFTQDVIELLIYNAKDALNTMKLKDPLYQEILNRGMNSQLVYYQMRFSELAARMEQVGVPVNLEKRRIKGEALKNQMDKALYDMRQYLNWPDFNPNKAQAHVAAALFDKKYCGLAPLKFTTKTFAPSTSYKAIIDYIEHPFVRFLIDYIETRVTYATQYKDGGDTNEPGSFAKSLHADGRFHPKWNPTGQKGSRFSSSPNFQNIASKHRDIYEAPPGRVLVGADKDQLELRIIACNAGVRELVEELKKPDADPHTLAAINVYGDEFLKRSKEDRKNLRNMVKNVVYASLYNAGAKTVHSTIREKKDLSPQMRAAMTLQVVTHIHKSYFGKYLEIPLLHEKNFKQAMNAGYNECAPLGRRRYYPVQPPPFTEVGNWQTQTQGSDHVGMEMVHIQDECDRLKLDAHIIVHGHDAVYLECPERHAEQVKDIVNQLFGKTKIEGAAGVVYLTAEAKIGKNLYEVK